MKIEKRFLEENDDVIGFDRDPDYTLRSIDQFLHRFGLEVVIVDNGSSDTWFTIKKRS